MKTRFLLLAIVCMFVFSACAEKRRLGMVEDSETGLQYGSIVERNLFVDPAQFQNRRIKVSIRNTSGDIAFDLMEFVSDLENAYLNKGYQPTRTDDFGVRLDLNILYSGAMTENMSTDYAFVGGAAGGIAGYRSNATAGTALGILSGATLGAIVGSYVTDDTYIVIAQVSIGILAPDIGKTSTTIVFSSSEKKSLSEHSGVNHYRQQLSTGIAVYAGGRNVQQSQIATGVRERLIRIVSDII